jgi:molecular chaperone DnaJ
VHHPDRSVADVGTMAAVNESYRVLRDPGRRALYDSELAGRSQRVTATQPEPQRAPSPYVRVPDPGPARYPWKLVIGGAIVGAAVVIGAAALYEPSPPPPPDNVLESGSCVVIEANGDAREVTCSGGDDDLVVAELVPLDGVCPPGVSAHRDRQGMGFACVRPPASTPPSEPAASLRVPERARSSVG